MIQANVFSTLEGDSKVKDFFKQVSSEISTVFSESAKKETDAKKQQTADGGPSKDAPSDKKNAPSDKKNGDTPKPSGGGDGKKPAQWRSPIKGFQIRQTSHFIQKTTLIMDGYDEKALMEQYQALIEKITQMQVSESDRADVVKQIAAQMVQTRIPAPKNITELGGYYNLLAKIERNREENLMKFIASALGLPL